MGRAFIDLFDKNGDGLISIEEFKKLYDSTMSTASHTVNFARVVAM